MTVISPIPSSVRIIQSRVSDDSSGLNRTAGFLRTGRHVWGTRHTDQPIALTPQKTPTFPRPLSTWPDPPLRPFLPMPFRTSPYMLLPFSCPLPRTNFRGEKKKGSFTCHKIPPFQVHSLAVFPQVLQPASPSSFISLPHGETPYSAAAPPPLPWQPTFQRNCWVTDFRF